MNAANTILNFNIDKDLDYRDITSFDKCIAEDDPNCTEIYSILQALDRVSTATAASFQINLLQSAINANNKDVIVDKMDSAKHIWYPYITVCSTDDEEYIENMKELEYIYIGSFKYNNKKFLVFTGQAYSGSYYSVFTKEKISFRELYGFVSYDRAVHFGKYFGMLVIQAKYGDLGDFEILEASFDE